METGLQLGSKLLQVGSKMRDLTWSNKDPCYKPGSIFETVVILKFKHYFFLIIQIKILSVLTTRYSQYLLYSVIYKRKDKVFTEFSLFLFAYV